jgi:hypothetical protein
LWSELIPRRGKIENEESKAILQRLFALAVRRVGSTAALGRQLGILYSELRTYLAGEAMPPSDVLLRAVDLVMEDLDEVQDQFSEQVWRSLPVAAARRS